MDTINMKRLIWYGHVQRSGGLKGCWIGCRTEEGKGEGLGEPGERTYMYKWNGGTYSTETGKIGKGG